MLSQRGGANAGLKKELSVRAALMTPVKPMLVGIAKVSLNGHVTSHVMVM